MLNRIGSKSRIGIVTILLIVAVSVQAYSDNKPLASAAEITEAFKMAMTIAEEVSVLRREMKTDEDLRGFFEAVVEAQKRIEPAIVLIAQTDSPKEIQVFAISVALVVKSTELAMWNYINTFVTDKQLYLDRADTLLGESMAEIERALTLAPTSATGAD